MVQKYILPVILYTFLTVSFINAESNAGNNGLAFLKIGAGGRAAGMGEAFTAVTNDASATYWNPAGIMLLNHGQFIFTHNKWFQDVSNNFGAVTFKIGKTSVGVSYISNNISGIETRLIPSTEPLSTIEAHDLMIGLSLARNYNENLSIGVTLKYLYEKIYLNTAHGGALDVGIHYKLPFNGLSFGAVIQNIGVMSEFKDEAIQLPVIMKGGLAYKLFSTSAIPFLVSADVLQIIDDSFHVNIGGEIVLRKQLALRAGYLTGYDERSMQAGFGLMLSRYIVDYAYVPFSSDLGNSHRVAFGINF